LGGFGWQVLNLIFVRPDPSPFSGKALWICTRHSWQLVGQTELGFLSSRINVEAAATRQTAVATSERLGPWTLARGANEVAKWRSWWVIVCVMCSKRAQELD